MHMDYFGKFEKALDSIHGGSRSCKETFSEFCLLARMCFQQAISFDRKREEEILKIQGASKKPDGYAEALAVLANALQHKTGDFLGAWAEHSGVLYGKRGQFFTPYNVSQLMAKIIFGKPQKRGRPLPINEPACGAGSMVIAAFETLRELGYGPRDFYVLAQDIDALCVNMAYIQCTLLGIPAIVRHGDTLLNQIYCEYPTLPFVMSFPCGVR